MDSSSPPDWRSSLTGSGDPLQAAARARPDAPALVGPEAGWTWRELHRIARRLAGALVDAVTPGDRVGVLADPGPEAVAAVHAVPRAGGVLVPLHPQWPAAELAACLEALDVRQVLVDRSEYVLPASVTARRIALDSSSTEDLPALPAARDPADEHTVLWTSGSAGRPRGVRLSALNHLASAVGVADRLGLRPGDHWALALSPAHIGGLGLILRCAATGGVVVAPGPLDMDRLAALIEAGHVSHVSLVPTQLHRLLESRGGRPAPRNLRVMLVGGDRTDDELLARALARGYPVALTYGLTEATAQVATAPPALVRRKPGTVGPPISGVDVRIAGDGEILVRGPTVMLGYATDAEQTAGDGWLHTGDLGRLDDEGHLYVTGRKAARIVSGGVTVDPAEVEGVLRSHPDVRDAAVTGLPDPEWGEVLAALVVPAGDAAGLAERLEAFCRERLAPACRPRRYVFTEGLPRTANGKLDLGAVRAAFTAA